VQNLGKNGSFLKKLSIVILVKGILMKNVRYCMIDIGDSEELRQICSKYVLNMDAHIEMWFENRFHVKMVDSLGHFQVILRNFFNIQWSKWGVG